MGFAVNILSARILGAEGYGYLAFGLSMLAILSVIYLFGLDQFTIRNIAPRKKNTAENALLVFSHDYESTWFIVCVSLSLSIFILLFYKVIISEINYGAVFALLFSPLVALVSYKEAVIRSLGYGSLSLLPSQIVRPATTLLLLLIFWLVGSVGLDFVFAAYGLGFLISLFLAFNLSKKKMIQNFDEDIVRLKLGFKSKLSITTMKNLALGGKGFFLVGIVTIISSKADVFILGSLESMSQVGVYAAAFNLSFLMIMVLQVVNLMVSPRLAAAHAENDMCEIKNILQQSRILGFTMALPLFLVFLTFSEFVLGLLGQEYIEGSSTLVILSIGMLVKTLIGSAGNHLLMSGNENTFSYVMFGSVLFSLPLIFFLVPLYGIEACAIVVALTTVLRSFAYLFISNRIIYLCLVKDGRAES